MAYQLQSVFQYSLVVKQTLSYLRAFVVINSFVFASTGSEGGHFHVTTLQLRYKMPFREFLLYLPMLERKITTSLVHEYPGPFMFVAINYAIELLMSDQKKRCPSYKTGVF